MACLNPYTYFSILLFFISIFTSPFLFLFISMILFLFLVSALSFPCTLLLLCYFISLEFVLYCFCFGCFILIIGIELLSSLRLFFENLISLSCLTIFLGEVGLLALFFFGVVLEFPQNLGLISDYDYFYCYFSEFSMI